MIMRKVCLTRIILVVFALIGCEHKKQELPPNVELPNKGRLIEDLHSELSKRKGKLFSSPVATFTLAVGVQAQ